MKSILFVEVRVNNKYSVSRKVKNSNYLHFKLQNINFVCAKLIRKINFHIYLWQALANCAVNAGEIHLRYEISQKLKIIFGNLIYFNEYNRTFASSKEL